jgi:type IV pilus assembly protein PilO
VASFSLSKLPWYAQLGAFAAVSVALAGAFYYFVEIKEQAAIEVQARDLSDIRSRITRAQTMARQLPEFRKQIDTLEARLDALKPILPDERDVGDLLRRVQTLASQSNLKVRGFRPQPITTRELHAEWPINLQLEGNYHNLGLFLDRVSKFPRIINISNMVMATKDSPTPVASPATTISIAATATTFVLVDPPPTPPEDPSKKGKGKKVPAKKTPAKK